MSKIDPDVLIVLKESTIEGNVLKLPNRQLDRDLYAKVNKVLTAYGGKWNRGQKGHVFSSCPKEKLGLVVETGTVRNEKKEYQAFYTPEDVAAEIIHLADIKTGQCVLEPSAGDGALAKPAFASGGKVTCCELNPTEAQKLRDLGFKVIEGDFLEVNPVENFDVVVMNPPFTKGQDMKHVQHAFKFLKKGGKLVSIMSPNFTFGTTKAAKAFREFVDEHGAVEMELEAGAFKSSGTNIRTVVVKLNK